MTIEAEQLVREAIDLTGASGPAMLDADAPVLTSRDGDGLYLIGLVGGKDVGKSSLVNAIVGQPITQPTSFGPGTQAVVAYAHESAADELRQSLSREVPERFSIVTHRVESLRRQVLLDLPDIDSKYSDHIQITRRMLRHMLYPVWIQSIEKYADLRPQELLAAVSEGNDPANFIFCLNKADQLSPQEQAELRDDYSVRLAKLLGLRAKPRVYLISARSRDQFDLPALREVLSQQRDLRVVKQSINLAQRRHDRSLLAWLSQQRLPERAAQLQRMEHDAQELLASRVALPIIENAIPHLLDDPGHRMALMTPAIRARLSRWPIVNAIDALLSPVLSLVHKNLSAAPGESSNPDAHLPGQSVAGSVQAAFAQLHQLHPQLGEIVGPRKLWETMHADGAAADLRRRFQQTADRHRDTIAARSNHPLAALLAPWRWLLTIGAVLWFPVVQPVLAVMLADGTWEFTKRTLGVLVDALSVTHLLQCATFLLLWFGILWLILRWGTQRKIARMLDRWKLDEGDELSLARQTVLWAEELAEPIRGRRQRVESLVERAEQLRASLSAPEAAERVPA